MLLRRWLPVGIAMGLVLWGLLHRRVRDGEFVRCRLRLPDGGTVTLLRGPGRASKGTPLLERMLGEQPLLLGVRQANGARFCIALDHADCEGLGFPMMLRQRDGQVRIRSGLVSSGRYDLATGTGRYNDRMIYHIIPPPGTEQLLFGEDQTR